jgi:tellurium resistance protein TerD
MAINLQKGQRQSINVQKFNVGLGWDCNESDTGASFDLDASAFILGANKKVLSDQHFVFYNNLESPDGSVIHTGDNRTGAGEGDDETLKVDLSVANPLANEICFVVTIHEAEDRKQNFGQVRNSFIRIYDPIKNEEILKFELGEDFSIETAVEFGKLYKKDGAWKFEAIGSGYKGGLQQFVNKYC